MERAKHRVFGSLLWTIIIDAVDKHRHAQDVGQQDELVAPFAAELANGLQKLDSARPFRVGKARFLHRALVMGTEIYINLEMGRHRVGEKWGSTCVSRWDTDKLKKKKTHKK